MNATVNDVKITHFCIIIQDSVRKLDYRASASTDTDKITQLFILLTFFNGDSRGNFKSLCEQNV